MKATQKISAAFITLLCFCSCTSVNLLNQYNQRGYTFILNDNDTLKFDKLYLDESYEHKFIVDKKCQTIRLNTGEDSLAQILSIKEIEELYKIDSAKIAFIVYDGNILSSSFDEKVFIQRSLVKDYDRIKKTIGCRNQGDVVIIK